MGSSKISVIIPVFNNSLEIEELCLRIIKTITQANLLHEIVLVNDQSTDNSLNIIYQIIKEQPTIKLINNSENIGQHKSILLGLSKAMGSYIVVMDGDLQDSPEQIISLYSKINEGYDLVFLQRHGIYENSSRMITSFFFKSVLSLATGIHRRAGSYFIIDQDLKNIIIEKNYWNPYITVIASHFASNIAYIRGKRNKRIGGQSGYTFKNRIKHAFIALSCKMNLMIR